MNPSFKRTTLTFGKRNWGVEEIKEALNIRLLHLSCQAPSEAWTGDREPSEAWTGDHDPQLCHENISIWNALKVRSLIQQLSDTPSDDLQFKVFLHQLANLMCCKRLHVTWARAVFEMWRFELHEAGESEGKYLEDRKNLQLLLHPRGNQLLRMVPEPAPEEENPSKSSARPLPRSRSVLTASRNPEDVRTGPKPIIHCIRHAEAGEGQEEDFFDRDPGLNEKGITECEALSKIFNRYDKVTHLVVSPLSRCVETALLTFAPTYLRGPKVCLAPEIQAAGSMWSSIGLPVDELRKKFSVEKYGDVIDFGCITDAWINKQDGLYSSDSRSVHERIKSFFQWCRDGQDTDDMWHGGREMVIITHQSVLNHWGQPHVPTSGWLTFTFDDDWKVYETEESRRRRHVPEPLVEVRPCSPSQSICSQEGMKVVRRASRLPMKGFSSVKYRPSAVSVRRDIKDDQDFLEAQRNWFGR